MSTNTLEKFTVQSKLSWEVFEDETVGFLLLLTTEFGLELIVDEVTSGRVFLATSCCKRFHTQLFSIEVNPPRINRTSVTICEKCKEKLGPRRFTYGYSFTELLYWCEDSLPPLSATLYAATLKETLEEALEVLGHLNPSGEKQLLSLLNQLPSELNL